MEKEDWDRYAKEYHQHVISPFQEDVKNPLFTELNRLPDTDQLVVADIGTGRGEILPVLSEKFKRVYAIDFSPEMLQIANQQNKHLTNIIFRNADTRSLTKLNLQLDVAIAVNSILHPSFEEVELSLSEIYNSLQSNGLFLGIFPSMEATLYNAMLVYEREYKKYNDEKRALRNTRRIVERKKFNFITSIYQEGEEKQKFYYKFELRNRLQQAGFKKIKFKKVLYPWKTANGSYEDFPGMPEMWDWFVTAKK